jgi:hypothetical protein
MLAEIIQHTEPTASRKGVGYRAATVRESVYPKLESTSANITFKQLL